MSCGSNTSRYLRNPAVDDVFVETDAQNALLGAMFTSAALVQVLHAGQKS
jgi:hypothetical protein